MTSKRLGITLEGDQGSNLKFEDLYSLEKRLRSGSYGTVFVTTHQESGEEFAVKVIDRTKLKKKSDDEAVFREVKVMKDLLDVPGIVGLVDFFVQPKEFHVVQVYARGGDVFDRLAHRTTYNEHDARELAKQLLLSIHAMHQRGYVHRDLKPENLLLKDAMDDSDILVADFGFSKKVPEGGLKTRCGTPAFVAPEVLLGCDYGLEVDIWSIGVLLFLLLGGYPPFQDQNHRGLFRKIRAADFVFHETYWEHVSIEAKQLIASLLVVNPDHRSSIAQALESSWILTHDDTLKGRDLSRSLSELRKFNGHRKLKSAMHAVTWATTAKFWNPDNVTFSHMMTTWDNSLGQHDASGTASQAETQASKVSKNHPKLSFRDLYDLKTKVRKGSFATVWECVHKQTQEVYAVKIIKREGLKPSEDEAVLNEVAILQSMAHKHIVQLVDFYEEHDYFFMVMEYMQGGDVFDRIVAMNQYTEKDARDLIRILIKAVKFMHEKGVAHRDLKPQNLLLKSKKDNADIKVADFGFARRVHVPQSLTTRCGTPTYVAPEILKNIPHDTMCDMWSVGVILYVLLVGYPPFMEDNQQELFRKIRAGTYEFYDEDWAKVSEDAKSLIRQLLVVDPRRRMDADEALRSSWINESDHYLSSKDLTESLRGIRDRRHRLRNIATAVMWAHGSKADPIPREVFESASVNASNVSGL